MTARNDKAIGFGVVLLVVGVLLAWSGLTPLSQSRDADGYLMSDPLTIDRATRAVVTYDVGLLRGHYACAAEESFILNFVSEPDGVRMQGTTSADAGQFLGIARAADVERYLDGVAHDEITEWDCDVDDITPVEYTSHEGTAIAEAPDAELFWVASAAGDGEQTVDWTIEDGDWAVVVMNADAASGVSAAMRFGALAPSGLVAMSWISLAAGLVAMVGGGLLLFLGRGTGDATLQLDESGIEPPELHTDQRRQAVGPRG